MTNNKPIKTVRAGSVSASIWENQIPVSGTTKNVLRASMQKRYKKKDGLWASSQSLSRDEVALAIYALSKCYEMMIVEGQVINGNNGSDTKTVSEEAVY